MKRKLRTGFSTCFGMNCSGKASTASGTCSPATQSVSRSGKVVRSDHPRPAVARRPVNRVSAGRNRGYERPGPVLVTPYAETFDNVGRRALIAWDGTREAVRALHGALPLLDRADAVMVIYVGVQQESLAQYRPSLERICGHLS